MLNENRYNFVTARFANLVTFLTKYVKVSSPLIAKTSFVTAIDLKSGPDIKQTQDTNVNFSPS